MKARKFAEILMENPEAEVVETGPDHSFKLVDVTASSAGSNGRGELEEYYGESNLSPGFKKIDVFHIYTKG